MKKLAILSTIICIIISIILIGIIEADAKTIYGMVWVGEDVETGDTIDVSNNTTFPQYHGVYANGANILDITQTILQGSFTMVMAVDVSKSRTSVGELRKLLEALGEKMEISIRIQREEIFDAMHRV